MRPIILMYHSVSVGRPHDPYGVSKQDFHDQILWLLDSGFSVVPLENLTRLGRKRLFQQEKRQIVLTFDDGYQDFFVNALPILLRYQLPATVFLVTDMLGQAASWSSYSSEDILMTEAEVRQVKAQGIGLGSHTLTHVDVTSLGAKELWHQLEFSRIALAGLGESFFSFSYPWGQYTRREAEALRAAGYRCAVTADNRPGSFYSDLYCLGRLPVQRDLTMDSFVHMINDFTLLRQIITMTRSLLRRMREKML